MSAAELFPALEEVREAQQLADLVGVPFVVMGEAYEVEKLTLVSDMRQVWEICRPVGVQHG